MTKPHTSSAGRRSRHLHSRQLGLTFVEMLVVMAVMAILVPIGISGLGQAATSMRLTSTSNALLSQLHLARSEAIKRNSRVVMCKSDDGLRCTATGGWEQGWIIFHDVNSNALREEAELMIQRGAPLGGNLKFTGNINVARYLAFAPNGATRLVGGGFQAGTLTLCQQSLEANEAREIVLNAVGRPRIRRVTIDSCS
ncbi:MAG: GspH/FimT family pseudopilin [Ramlibacter sp.]|nr:GspH/FimT family pseudopilin [Ramlibacter sp.]